MASSQMLGCGDEFDWEGIFKEKVKKCTKCQSISLQKPQTTGRPDITLPSRLLSCYLTILCVLVQYYAFVIVGVKILMPIAVKTIFATFVSDAILVQMSIAFTVNVRMRVRVVCLGCVYQIRCT